MGRNRGNKKNKEDSELIIKQLKAANRRLKSDNQRLKAEIETLHEAFNRTSVYIKNNTDNISVEKIIDGVKKGETLQKIKKENRCKTCNSDNVKNLNVPGVGSIMLCANCKYRQVVKNEEKN